MIVVSGFLVVVCSFTAFVDLLLLYLWSFHRKEYKEPIPNLPSISVLVAARNEEANLSACLDSLLQLDYPQDRLEILVGDDNSTDSTWSIASSYAKKKQVSAFQIQSNLGSAKGKANVLAHLAQQAQNEVFLITDADVIVPKGWVKGMISGLLPKVGIVNGFTIVKNNVWQCIDWLFALGMVKVITDSFRPVTAMGNNMLVTRKAYESTGGYESIPFSITEDFELFKQVSKRGFKTVQLMNTDVLATTLAQSDFKGLLNQRKRWMRGAVQLPWPIVSILSLQALFFPGILALIVINPQIGTFILASKVLLQSAFILTLASYLKLRFRFHQVLLYEFYSLYVAITTGIFYLLPTKVSWKGRKY
ncbi:glycosyltransferase [Fulvivirga sp. RKSG066]|uniref:glycosyltransferase n=1 Tax=Fulvivirga aurantia TaxID=2529383 RepID=UPI0012BC52F1|nr:glycosyltransferase [Fulvivirga aurantia]MTI20460.1 glycosyltransferase [Fulvivirga aurantia]